MQYEGNIIRINTFLMLIFWAVIKQCLYLILGELPKNHVKV